MFVGRRSDCECGKAWDQAQVFIAAVGYDLTHGWLITTNYIIDITKGDLPTNIANEEWFP